MVYLYAGLGIAMLSGIMAIFEMGLAVTGQSLLRFESRYHASNYFQDTSLERSNDIELMSDLLDGTWKRNFIAANPGVSINCGNYHDFENYSWRPVANSRCESEANGRRILVDIISDQVVYICFPAESNGPCSFEEES